MSQNVKKLRRKQQTKNKLKRRKKKKKEQIFIFDLSHFCSLKSGRKLFCFVGQKACDDTATDVNFCFCFNSRYFELQLIGLSTYTLILLYRIGFTGMYLYLSDIQFFFSLNNKSRNLTTQISFMTIHAKIILQKNKSFTPVKQLLLSDTWRLND